MNALDLALRLKGPLRLDSAQLAQLQSALEEAVAQERERCAAMVDRSTLGHGALAAAIRSRTD